MSVFYTLVKEQQIIQYLDLTLNTTQFNNFSQEDWKASHKNSSCEGHIYSTETPLKTHPCNILVKKYKVLWLRKALFQIIYNI